MTNKEFLNAVISASLSDEITEKATTMLKALENERSKANARNNSKKLAENAPFIASIREIMEDGIQRTTSEIAEKLGVHTSKASPLLRGLVAEGFLTEEEVHVKGKGKVKAYTKA